MKRRFVKLLLLLLLFSGGGAIINVAVAWGCAYLSDVWLGEEVNTDVADWMSLWNRRATNNWNSIQNPMGYRLAAPGVALDHVSDESSSGLFGPSLTEYRCGWPFLALATIHRNSILEAKGWQFAVVFEGSHNWGYGLHMLVLPVEPIWPGFAINTVFYAAVLWVLIAGPGAVRRLVRRRRGRCTRCGYDLRGQVAASGFNGKIVCPECGTRA
jgi:hypothetical protein